MLLTVVFNSIELYAVAREVHIFAYMMLLRSVLLFPFCNGFDFCFMYLRNRLFEGYRTSCLLSDYCGQWSDCLQPVEMLLDTFFVVGYLMHSFKVWVFVNSMTKLLVCEYFKKLCTLNNAYLVCCVCRSLSFYSCRRHPFVPILWELIGSKTQYKSGI